MLSRMMCVIIVVALGGFVMVTGAAYADTMIDIANPGFESGPDQGTPSDWSTYDANHAGRWTITGGLPPHGGSYWGYIDPNDDLYQALMIGSSNLQVSVGDQITINLYQGKRTDQGSNVQALDVRIWKDAVGGVIGNLLGDSGSFSEAPAGGWAARTYTYTADSSAVGHNLYVELAEPNPSLYQAQLNVDDVSGVYTPVPEPSTIALLATGLLSLLAYAWRKRR